MNATEIGKSVNFQIYNIRVLNGPIHVENSVSVLSPESILNETRHKNMCSKHENYHCGKNTMYATSIKKKYKLSYLHHLNFETGSDLCF